MDRLTADHSVPTSPVSALMLTFLSSLGGVFEPSSLAGASVLPGFWKHGQQQLAVSGHGKTKTRGLPSHQHPQPQTSQGGELEGPRDGTFPCFELQQH